MTRTDQKPAGASIVPGGKYAGNVFRPSVRTLVDEIKPQVSMPPGNSAELQVCAGFHFRIKKPQIF
jgi:hypothetical protein